MLTVNDNITHLQIMFIHCVSKKRQWRSTL